MRLHICQDLAVAETTVVFKSCGKGIEGARMFSSPRFCKATRVVALLLLELLRNRVKQRPKFCVVKWERGSRAMALLISPRLLPLAIGRVHRVASCV
jgi:hypothetical protein